MLTLYSYCRSTTSCKGRIALNLKGLSYQAVRVDRVARAKRAPDYVSKNPSKGLPTPALEDATALTQPPVIVEYLDHNVPDPARLPNDSSFRSKAQAAARIIATDIHPVDNLKIVSRLKSEHGQPAKRHQMDAPLDG